MIIALPVPCQAAASPARPDFAREALALATDSRWNELKSLASAERTSSAPHPTCVPFLAFADFGLGAPENALTILEPYLSANSDLPLVWWVAGLSHLQLGAFDLAVQDARRLGDLQPMLAFELLQRPAILKHLGCEGPLPRRVSPQAERQDQPPAPSYPADARRQGIHGDIVMDLILDAGGRPLAVRGVWGPEPLVPAALRYVKTFTFKQILPTKGPMMLRFVMPFRLVQGGHYQAAPKNLLVQNALEETYDAK